MDYISNIVAMSLLSAVSNTNLTDVDLKTAQCFSPSQYGCVLKTRAGDRVLSHQRMAEITNGGPVEVLQAKHNPQTGITKIIFVDRTGLNRVNRY